MLPSNGKKRPDVKSRMKTKDRQMYLRQLEEETSADPTIGINDLYEQLQSLKHEIDIENLQKKIKVHEEFFGQLGDDKETLLKMIKLFKEKSQ
ncbi:MAG: hypothetical protein GY866_11580 [Proteobacteria bacterium]|nr:hypothetical protein [Pseudomonadota bacterium]